MFMFLCVFVVSKRGGARSGSPDMRSERRCERLGKEKGASVRTASGGSSDGLIWRGDKQ